ncbi:MULTISPECIES: hypothetical protein [unclassified Streptomyces]|uniref:hypothetical protein n=1 Tax=unclassified Streptomyces TaxID=2593676 RepID=UPI001E2BE9D2|nr:hypothetical protein [Streptomyces sp. UNOB3_S3]MCC3776637.1 hypothetical protein [Streptomyces sp. UNOB3_S3]
MGWLQTIRTDKGSVLLGGGDDYVSTAQDPSPTASGAGDEKLYGFSRYDKVAPDQSNGLAYMRAAMFDRAAMMEIGRSGGGGFIDEPARSACCFAQDGNLYVGLSDRGDVRLYTEPVNGTRKGSRSPTHYDFNSSWSQGVTDLAVGKAGSNKKFFALSGHTNGGNRQLYAGEMSGGGSSAGLLIDPTIDVHASSRFVAVDASSSYVFVAGDGTLQRLNLLNSKGSLISFPNAGTLCCPPVFSDKSGTVYCCTVENNGGKLQAVRYVTTDPSSRKTLDLTSAGSLCAGAAVDPATQNLWVFRGKDSANLELFEVDPTTPSLLKTFTASAGKPPGVRDNWGNSSCFTALFSD